MTLTLHQAFDLPSRETITALGFVVRLEAGTDAERTRRLVDDYVLTPTVRQELPLIFAGLHQAWQRGEDLGRFIHGSFGSGKSHFMSMLGLWLEDSDAAWQKPDPLIGELSRTHRGWIREARYLVVRLHMLTAASRGAGLDRAIYEAYGKTFKARSGRSFEFLHVEGVLAEARRESEQYGDAFWHGLHTAGIVDSRAAFEEMAAAGPEEREDLARAYLTWKGRDLATAGIDPNWAEGLQRLCRSARDAGHGGVIFLIDELLLWLSEKTGPEFKAAINQLNVMVDHTDGRRALPLGVFVARQRALSEFFPDLVQEDQLHEHLDHHSKRFEQTTLNDVELRHICKERVLKQKTPAEVAAVVEGLAERHRRLLPALLHGADVEYLRDVYPFHPALIEMLMDVSSLMQRERTALRLLYELLVIHHPDLPLGEFLPVGAAFEALFPEHGVEAARRVEDLRAIHRLYYQRFRPVMKTLLDEGWSGFDEGRRRALDQVVKTALLGEISPRLKSSGGMSVERLVRLNDCEVQGETERSKIALVYQDLVELGRRVPALQLTGTGRTAVVGIVLQGVNFAEVMERAIGKANNNSARFRVFYRRLRHLLGLEGRPGFGEGAPNEGGYEIAWRGTRRRGWVGFKNIRTQQNVVFKPQPGENFRILIDYPWDDLGHGVEEDRQRARDVRRREGALPTICWLPRHLAPSEEEVLVDLVAAEYIASTEGQEELLGNLGPNDRQQVIEQAHKRAAMMSARLDDILREVYQDHGEALALQGEGDVKVAARELHKNLGAFAEQLLDRQFPQHPNLGLEPRPEDLGRLGAWLVEAAEAPEGGLPFDEALGRILRGLGQPLELVDLGQVRGRFRRGTRYIKAVFDRAQADVVRWDAIDQFLDETFGFQPPVRNLFLLVLVRVHSFRAVEETTGETVEIRIDHKPRAGLKLVRAPLVDAAAWSRLRELGPALFEELKEPASHRTLTEQDRYAEALVRQGSERRRLLERLHEQVVRLEPVGTARQDELRQAIARLRPLERAGGDSHQVLLALLAEWPDDAGDALRRRVREAPRLDKALAAIDATTRALLGRGMSHPVHGVTAKAHLDTLRQWVGQSDGMEPLTAERIEKWNTQAREIAHRLVETPVHGSHPEPRPDSNLRKPDRRVDPTPGITPLAVYERQRVRVGDEAFWRELRQKLAALAQEELEIDVTVWVRSSGKE